MNLCLYQSQWPILYSQHILFVEKIWNISGEKENIHQNVLFLDVILLFIYVGKLCYFYDLCTLFTSFSSSSFLPQWMSYVYNLLILFKEWCCCHPHYDVFKNKLFFQVHNCLNVGDVSGAVTGTCNDISSTMDWNWASYIPFLLSTCET